MKTLKKVVIAPDSFKESLSALGVADAIERGFRQIYPQAHYVKLPMADGGEGTVESMVAATGGEIVQVTVTGPLGEPVQGFYGLLGDGETAVIEMAAASGLHLAPPGRRDPRITTSYGTGELMLAALERGVKAVILGIGGSATNDGGAGMMQALGVKLLDKARRPLPAGGAALAQLAHLDLAGLDARWQRVSVTAACDVDNPLCGEKGASAVFGSEGSDAGDGGAARCGAVSLWRAAGTGNRPRGAHPARGGCGGRHGGGAARHAQCAFAAGHRDRHRNPVPG